MSVDGVMLAGGLAFVGVIVMLSSSSLSKGVCRLSAFIGGASIWVYMIGALLSGSWSILT